MALYPSSFVQFFWRVFDIQKLLGYSNSLFFLMLYIDSMYKHAKVICIAGGIHSSCQILLIFSSISMKIFYIIFAYIGIHFWW